MRELLPIVYTPIIISLFLVAPATVIAPMNAGKARLCLFVLCVMSVAVGCSLPANLDVAKNATTAFHDQVDKGHYDAIYEATTASFKSVQTREQAKAFLKGVNRRLGACTASTLTGANFLTNTQGTFVVLGYMRKCANGDLSEQLTWQIVGNKVLLAAFNANSPAFVGE